MEYPNWLDRSLFPFDGKYIEVDGCNVHYVDEGSGKTILFLHGNPTWSFLYRDIIKSLRGKYRCIAPDYPGFGFSTPAEDYGFTPREHSKVIERFIEKLGLKDVTLMVQDWGGPIGLRIAGSHPALFGHIIIGNTWGWPVDGDPHFERFSNFLGGTVGQFLIRHLNIFVNQIIPAGVKRKKLLPEVMSAYRGPFMDKMARRSVEVFPKEILESRDFLILVEKGLERLQNKPVLILWGNKDVAFRKKELERWKSFFPSANTVMLEGAGHYIQEDAPEEIAAAITDWLK
jgi:haloalkane dehalogenase